MCMIVICELTLRTRADQTTSVRINSLKLRSLSFLLRRRSRRRPHPSGDMSKKKRQKNKPPVRIPTGSIKPSTSSSPVKSKTPDSFSAVKQKDLSDSSLAGAAAHSTHSSVPDKTTSSLDLVEKTETPNSKTLATKTPSVPSAKKQSDIPVEDKNHYSSDQTSSPPPAEQKNPAEIWKAFVKDSTIKLQPKETPYYLDSGKGCVTIPNSVVEKNKKAWEYFILGQFYDEPPARAAIHAIVNGIWSRQKRDITVNKMDGNAFLFRVPDPNARRRILSQSLWQIDGQTMFVAKWSPGIQQAKPELDMVPVWLEFTGVPLQFFNRDALQEIAGIVGHPVCLHPSTETLTNIEVAKVYTVIDPRKPLPDFFNARYESGDTRRIGVSSPWLSSLCSYCKKFGHTISRCKVAPKTCTTCNSVRHETSACPRTNHASDGNEKRKGKAPIKNLLPIVPQPNLVYKQVGIKTQEKPILPAQTNDTPNKEQIVTQPPADTITDQPGTSKIAHTTSVEYDLREGSIYVDLKCSPNHTDIQQSSSGSSSGTSTSEDENNSNDGSDQFIEVFTKRMMKHAKAKEKARGRGPQIL